MFKRIPAFLAIAAPFALTAAVAMSGCSLVIDEEGLINQEGVYPCESDNECTANYRCAAGMCISIFSEIPCNDQDGDGYGVGTTEELENCSASSVDIDFDDTCKDCFPGAEEICDGVDNNGDMQTDEPTPCAGTALDCPTNFPVNGSQFRCIDNQCILTPSVFTGECAGTEIPCAGGTYDTTEAAAKGCLPM